MESTTRLTKHSENGKLLPFYHFPYHPASTTFSMGGKSTHQNFPVEEQPAWLDDLLNDSDALFHRGHRRAVSDSCAYMGAAADALDDESEFVNAYFGSSPDNTFNQTKESGEVGSSVAVEHSGQDSSTQSVEGSADKAGGSGAKTAGSKTELKRAKQHNAQRSRVRKLQYIAHLERTVEILKAEGAGVSAELEFIEQQNIILTMENRALRQRLENISQEQMIKQWEQGMLEREIGRLQSLYHLQKQQQMQLHHQQQPHNQHSKHRRNRSRDLDDQMNSSITMKNKDPVNGPIRV